MRHLRPTCSACAFWLPEPGANAAISGHCHRYPPGVLINPETGIVVQKFPTTDHHHWCGEWNGDDAMLAEAARKAVLKSAAVAN